MLNLRQFNKSGCSQSNSDAQHFSRLSASFRVPSNLGNIGKDLDHSQSEQLHEDEPAIIHADEIELNTTNLESAEPVAGPCGTRWDKESDAKGINRQSNAPTAGSSGSRRDHPKTADASLGEVVNVANSEDVCRSVTLAEQVHAASQLESWIRTEG